MSTPGRKRVQPILIDDDDNNDEMDEDLPSSEENPEFSFQSQPSTPNPCLSIEESKPAVRKDIYVALNFDELSHIRNAQTNAEFASLLYDFTLYKLVVNGQLCFSCRKVEFSIFKAGQQCTICLQQICRKCQRKLTLRSDNICFVSLNLLRRSSTSSNSSITNMSNQKNKRNHRTKLCNNTLICCIDCFILFDPSSLC